MSLLLALQGGGVGVTGTGANTAGDVSSSGVGTLPVSGTAASATSAASTGTGATAVSGTAASTTSVASTGTGNLTLVALGGTGTGVTSAATSGTGAVAVSGTGTGTISVASAGAGAADIQGTAASTTSVTSVGAGTLTAAGIAGTAASAASVASTGAGNLAIHGAGANSTGLASMGTGEVPDVFFQVSSTRAAMVYRIALLHGLDINNPMTVSANGRSAGTLIQTVSGSTAVTISTTSAPPLVGNLDDWIDSLAALHGLTADLVVTPTSRTAGPVTQNISTQGLITTVTRT